MMVGKWIYIFTAIVLLPGTPLDRADAAGKAKIEIVESVPVETTLDDPDIRNTLEVWLEMIGGARKTLDIAEFYISNKAGEPLEDVIKAVVDASNRGVKVRVIADSKFHKIYPETLDILDKEMNISVRIMDVGDFTGGVMHAKYFVVDKDEVFLGSQNFDWRSLKHIREIGVRISDWTFARILTDLFELDWRLCKSGYFKATKKALKLKKYLVPVKMSAPDGERMELTPVYSPAGLLPDDDLWNEKKIVELLDSAKKEILIQMLSYSYVSRSGEFYPTLDNALRRAAIRGVNVKIIAADWAKKPPSIHHLKSLAVIPNINVKLSTIPEWSGGFIPFARVEHCKLLVVDDSKSWIGSSNWSKDYFHNSRNVGVVVKGKYIAALLRKMFSSSWTGPYTYFVRPEEEYVPPNVAESGDTKKEEAAESEDTEDEAVMESGDSKKAEVEESGEGKND